MTESGSTPVVHVTNHAVSRLFARHRDATASMSSDAARELIRQEVTAAIIAGRVACRQPRWTVMGLTGHRRRVSRTGIRKRHVWNAEETRCYVTRRETGAWIVLTTLGAAS